MHSITFDCFSCALQLGRTCNCYLYQFQIPEYNETLFGFDFIEDTVKNNTVTIKPIYIYEWIIIMKM